MDRIKIHSFRLFLCRLFGIQSKYRIVIAFHPSLRCASCLYPNVRENVYECVCERNETIPMLIASDTDLMIFAVFYLIESIEQIVYTYFKCSAAILNQIIRFSIRNSYSVRLYSEFSGVGFLMTHHWNNPQTIKRHSIKVGCLKVGKCLWRRSAVDDVRCWRTSATQWLASQWCIRFSIASKSGIKKKTTQIAQNRRIVKLVRN